VALVREKVLDRLVDGLLLRLDPEGGVGKLHHSLLVALERVKRCFRHGWLP